MDQAALSGKVDPKEAAMRKASDDMAAQAKAKKKADSAADKVGEGGQVSEEILGLVCI